MVVPPQPQDNPEILDSPIVGPQPYEPDKRKLRLSKAGMLGLVAACVVVSVCVLLAKVLLNPTIATVSKPELVTAAGIMQISGVDLVSQFPPGCTSGPTCQIPKSGYHILAVYLQRKDGGSIDDVSQELFSEAIPLLDGSKNPGSGFVTSNDGKQAQLSVLQVVNSRIVLIFPVPLGSQEFTLTWPNNPPIPLF